MFQGRRPFQNQKSASNPRPVGPAIYQLFPRPVAEGSSTVGREIRSSGPSRGSRCLRPRGRFIANVFQRTQLALAGQAVRKNAAAPEALWVIYP